MEVCCIQYVDIRQQGSSTNFGTDLYFMYGLYTLYTTLQNLGVSQIFVVEEINHLIQQGQLINHIFYSKWSFELCTERSLIKC